MKNLEKNKLLDEESKIRKLVERIPRDVKELNEAVIKLRIEYVRRMQELARAYGITEDGWDSLIRKPYTLLPKPGTRDEWYCIVPKVFDFQVGYLDHSNESFNVFVITRYTQWLSGGLPAEIREEVGFRPPEPIKIEDGILTFPEGFEEIVQLRYGKYLTSVARGKARVKQGKEFDVIAEIIENGSLPFVPKQVDQADLREPEVRFELGGKYEFQREAYETFLRYGAVGCYWMPGAGKSFLAMYILDSLKGRKLIVTPTLTLIEQWRDYFKQYAPRLLDECEVVTYHAYPKIKGNEYMCTCFDECQALPADQFSRMATIRTKYRIGLSATPYREDGRTNYIMALTGYPIGLDWRQLMKLLGKVYHEVDVYVLKSRAEKLSRIRDLIDPEKKTVIYCDGIDFGKQIAQKIGAEFIYGATKDRLEKIREQKVTVVSRVGDLGISLPGLECVIEADFLMGSRAQEVQRTGRLLHSLGKVKRHHILFTEEEFFRYRKRLAGLIEKGFKINMQMMVRRPLIFEAPRKTRPRIQKPKVAAPMVAPQVISEVGKMPILDERTAVNRETIKFLLRTPYAKSKQGLTLGEMTEILRKSHIHFNYDYFKVMVNQMFKAREIDGARVGAKNRRYYLKETLTA